MNPIDHCLDKIEELCRKAQAAPPQARDLFQMGYNAGRAAELAGEGRDRWWDLFKGRVEARDWDAVAALAAAKRKQRAQVSTSTATRSAGSRTGRKERRTRGGRKGR
ncbi:MAG: hypothetical protein HYU36_07880 [Planctomycetes bacterium]|nr:hypothetical protein [Planctomycetota bacterium]